MNKQTVIIALCILLLTTQIGCKKEKKDEPTPLIILSLKSKPTVKMKVNGQDLMWENKLSSGFISSTSESYNGSNFTAGSFLSNIDETQGVYIRIGEIKDFVGSLSEFKQLIAKKNYLFSEMAQNGVHFGFSYQGKYYDSDNAPDIKNVGQFSIEDVSYEENNYGLNATIYAKFNVTLYTENGVSIKLTDGEYVGGFSTSY